MKLNSKFWLLVRDIAILIAALGMYITGGYGKIIGVSYGLLYCWVLFAKWRNNKLKNELKKEALAAIARIEQHNSQFGDVSKVREALHSIALTTNDTQRAIACFSCDRQTRRVDCQYYSRSHHLSCAVRPTSKNCEGCLDYVCSK